MDGAFLRGAQRRTTRFHRIAGVWPISTAAYRPATAALRALTSITALFHAHILSQELRRKRATHAVDEGQGPARFEKAEKGDRGQRLLNQRFILFALKAASAVNQNASRLEQLGGPLHERQLLGGHANEILLREPPADVHAPAD